MGKLVYFNNLKQPTIAAKILLIAIIIMIIALGLYGQHIAQALTLKEGQSGESVKALQQELKNQGFYSGNIDGYYGPLTVKAVRTMQERYGLSADGIAGEETLKALGLDNLQNQATSSNSGNSGSSNAASSGLNSEELNLLAATIHAEAEGEPYIGKVAVGAVLLNRIEHRDFPNSLSEVIYQSLAIESVANGRLDGSIGAESLAAAEDALAGWDPTYGCLYFWNPATATSTWIWSREIAVTYGNHVFGK